MKIIEEVATTNQVKPPVIIGFSPLVNKSLNLILNPTPAKATVTKNL